MVKITGRVGIMGITVREAMKLGVFEKCELIAGSNGLDRVIVCVDSMEVPNIAEWLKPGEFLITTAYSMRERPEELADIVEALHQKEASGLAVKTRFIGAIPEKAIEKADLYGIPVFKVPAQMPFLDISEPLFRAIIDKQDVWDKKKKARGYPGLEVQSEHMRLIGANFYTDIIMDNIKTEEEAGYRAQYMGWPRPPFAMLVLDIDGFESKITHVAEEEVQRIKKQTEHILNRLLYSKRIPNAIVSKSDRFSCLLSGSYKKEVLLSDADRMQNEIKDKLQLNVTVGIVEKVDGYLGIRKAHEDARDSIQICRIRQRPGQKACISDVRFDQAILRSKDNQYLKDYVSNMLNSLEEYDKRNSSQLLYTLEILVKNMGVRTKAAEELYLHRNTLLNRIHKIEVLTGFNISDTEQLFELGLAIRMKPYISLQQ